jgi:hypothetical protein
MTTVKHYGFIDLLNSGAIEREKGVSGVMVVAIVHGRVFGRRRNPVGKHCVNG